MSISAQQGVSVAGDVGLAIATGGTSAIITAAVAGLSVILSQLGSAQGSDSTTWKTTLSKYNNNIKAITYLDYIQTLPFATGGHGDAQDARFNQFRENFGQLLKDGSVSTDIADAWNAQWELMAQNRPGGPDENLNNSKFSASTNTDSGYIENGQISKQGVVAAGNTGLIAANTFNTQYAAAPIYAPPVTTTVTSGIASLFNGSATGTGTNGNVSKYLIIIIAIVLLIVILKVLK